MPSSWRTEYHVLDKDGEAVDWVNTKTEAIALAKTLEGGSSVEKVVSYSDDRKTVWSSEDDPDDDAD